MALDATKNLEIHVASICVRQSRKGLEVFVFKRSSERRLYPNLWECGGGQVRPGESLKEAAVREVKEETNLVVKPLMLYEDYTIEAPMLPQKIIPGVKFICLVKSKNPKIVLQEGHTEYRWISEKDLGKEKLDFIPRVKNDIKKAFFLVERLKLI
jgi:mutator protein MutT